MMLKLNIKDRLAACLMIAPIAVFATPLSSKEKLDFVRSASASCIAKQNANRNLSAKEKDGINLYCTCHASTLSSLVTTEELLEFSKGLTPSQFSTKVAEARKQCINALLAN
jgi:hypothetical protein